MRRYLYGLTTMEIPTHSYVFPRRVFKLVASFDGGKGNSCVCHVL